MKSLKVLATAIALFGFMAIVPQANAQTQSPQSQIKIESQKITPAQSTNNDQAHQAKIEKAFDLLFNQKNYRAAIQAFDELINVEPNNPFLYFGRGLGKYLLEDFRAAKADFDKSIQIYPEISFIFPEVRYSYFYRGFTNYALGDKKSAIADLQVAKNLFEKEGDKKMAQQIDEYISKIRNT